MFACRLLSDIDEKSVDGMRNLKYAQQDDLAAWDPIKPSLCLVRLDTVII